MKRIVIECPHCGQKLSFYEVRGYQQMMVTCPSCMYRAKAAEFRDVQASAPAAVPPNGRLREVSTGKTYTLPAGSNIVGRKATTGTANIQIDTTDQYMSRQHVRIDVIPTPEGSFEHRLMEIKATNKVKYNGTNLAPGEIVNLRAGDKITLGHTELVFEV